MRGVDLNWMAPFDTSPSSFDKLGVRLRQAAYSAEAAASAAKAGRGEV